MSSPAADATLVAVDTGGTFTDVVLLTGGGLRVLKLPSTPDDPASAVIDGIRAAAPGAGFRLVHGSTVATNTLLERTGARVGLVTNAGIEDVIEIGRQNRPRLYALSDSRPPPLVAPADRVGIAGRIGPSGAEEDPVDAAELAALGDRLREVDAVAVALLHSYADPGHERRVLDALASLGVPVTLSSALLPEYREYERTATAVVNAYVTPRMDGYLERVEADAGAERVRIMGSGGGALPVSRARSEPAHTILSGPAGGVIGALEAARAAGIREVISFDMGGTSTDVSLCPGRPLHTREFRIADLPVALPFLDIHTVGAGGGSIAWIDAGGALRVGPRSAGAVPGPICYGAGGEHVTVTDAHVWTGRLPPDAFLGGERTLERAAITAPLEALALRLGLSADEVAEGVVEIADAAMEGALRLISVERGYDPADFTLVAFGGAAGLHAAELGARLGVSGVLVPPHPGVLSALGMLAAPVRRDVSRTVMLTLPVRDGDRLESVFLEMEREALTAMTAEGLPAEDVRLARAVDARYPGQSHELRIPAGDADLAASFQRAYEARYGYSRPDSPMEVVTARVEALAPAPALPSLAPGPGEPSPARDVEVVFDGERLTARSFQRSGLASGRELAGPAIVVEYSATTWIPPGWTALVHESGGLLLGADAGGHRPAATERSPS